MDNFEFYVNEKMVQIIYIIIIQLLTILKDKFIL